MNLSYGLDSTTIEVTPTEVDQHHGTLKRARKSEESKGRKVTVLVRLEIHEASEKQVELAPRSRLFPRPIAALGALVPEIIADRLRQYAREREQPLSDLSRVLWTEFLIAKKRGERGDGWAKFIERQLNDVLALRQDKKKISYARTRQMSVRRGRSRNRRGNASRG